MPSENKLKGVLLVAAAIIAGVRLARKPVGNTLKVLAVITDSVKLAEMILKRVESRWI